MKAVNILCLFFLFVLCSCQSKKQKVEQVSTIDTTLQVRVDSISQKKSETLTKEQQEFCINTFKLYLNVDESRIEESLEFIKLLVKYSDGDNETQEYFQRNIVHIDSVMQHCIELVKQEDYKKLIDIFEKERMNIAAHPNNTVDNEWHLYSVFALLYAQYIEDDKDYYTKLAELGEWSRMHIEAVQANWKEPHPLYKQVLNELLQIYEALNNPDKKAEIEKLYAALQKEE